MVLLSITQGPRQGQLVVRAGETKLLGRGPNADLDLGQDELAARQLAVTLNDEGVFVVDLVGGALLDGEALPLRKPTPVGAKANLQVGECVVRLLVLRDSRRVPKASARTRRVSPLPADFSEVRQIGRGAQGRVYSARWEGRAERVAVKVFKGGVKAGSPEHLRFLREAETAQKIESPFVTKVYELRVADGTSLIVMELVEGPSASELITACKGRVPLARALSICHQVAQALAAAARVGVVHRDVKPANVLLPEGGGVKLCDFGLAKSIERTAETLTATGIGLGSLGYLAPEQLLDAKRADARADVYSLGASLFHLLAGAPPFVPQSLDEVLAMVGLAPPPLAEIRPELPAAVVEQVERMMSKDPAGRPPPWKVVEELAALTREAGG